MRTMLGRLAESCIGAAAFTRTAVLAAMFILCSVAPGQAPHNVALSTSSSALNASPWELVYIHAQAGNGCIDYALDQRLEPLTSQICADSNTWYVRDLSRYSGAIQAGDQLEFVDSNFQYAMGYSGGLEKLETPNSSTTFVYAYVGQIGSWFGLYNWETTGQFLYPSGRDQDLQFSNMSIAMTWTLCGIFNPTCGPGYVL